MKRLLQLLLTFVIVFTNSFIYFPPTQAMASGDIAWNNVETIEDVDLYGLDNRLFPKSDSYLMF